MCVHVFMYWPFYHVVSPVSCVFCYLAGFWMQLLINCSDRIMPCKYCQWYLCIFVVHVSMCLSVIVFLHSLFHPVKVRATLFLSNCVQTVFNGDSVLNCSSSVCNLCRSVHLIYFVLFLQDWRFISSIYMYCKTLCFCCILLSRLPFPKIHCIS